MLACGGRAFQRIPDGRLSGRLRGKSKIVPQQKGDVVAALKLKYFKQEHWHAY
jgi:hypothetical protein